METDDPVTSQVVGRRGLGLGWSRAAVPVGELRAEGPGATKRLLMRAVGDREWAELLAWAKCEVTSVQLSELM